MFQTRRQILAAAGLMLCQATLLLLMMEYREEYPRHENIFNESPRREPSLDSVKQDSKKKRKKAKRKIVNEETKEDDASSPEIADEPKKKRACWVKDWLLQRQDPNHANTLNQLQMELLDFGEEDEFHLALRMPPDVYGWLLERLRPRITMKHTQFRKPISAEERLAICLRYMVLGDPFHILQYKFCVSRNMIGRIVRQVSKAIWDEFMEEYIETPATTEEWMVISQGFWQKWKMPHTIGAVGAKHIMVKRPKNDHFSFKNHKGYYSISLLVMADHNYMIRYVDCGIPGAEADSSIWRRSSLYSWMALDGNRLNLPLPTPEEGMPAPIPYFLIADETFAMDTFLMTPFPQASENSEELIFNKRINQGKQVADNALGILLTKFRIFQREIEMEPDGCDQLTLAAVVLHNILTKQAPSYIHPSMIDHLNKEGKMVPGVWRDNFDLANLEDDFCRKENIAAKKHRKHLCQFFTTPHGKVPWQYESKPDCSI